MKIGVVMDPIAGIKTYKDTTFAMMLEVQARGWDLRYMEQGDLRVRDGRAQATMRPVTVRDDPADWFELGEPELRELTWLDAILMRKDPPFDMEYVFATHILELAERAGTLVVNKPRALRDANEKLYTALFPQCTPPTLVTRRGQEMRDFLEEQGEIILKPLDSFGGASIFRIAKGDPNTGVAIETLTAYGTRYAMAQRYLPEIADGDKRVLVVDGEPVPYALARVPLAGESRGNLAAGGTGVPQPLGDRERWICEQLAPTLKDNGLLFVGLDMIGDYLTEINVTSPTCVRELDRAFGINISAMLMDRIVERVYPDTLS